MDYQCLFNDAFVDGQHSRRRPSQRRSHNGYKATFYSKEEEVEDDRSRPIRLLLFKHEDSSILTEDNVLPVHEIEEELGITDVEAHANLRLILSPPREYKKDELGRTLEYDRGAPIPFGDRTFRRIVDTLHFHRACLASGELAQVSRVIGPNNVTSFYIETLSYRIAWYKLSVSYSPATLTTSAFLHNLSSSDSQIVTSKLLHDSVQPLTIHPMLLPLLFMDLQFSYCTHYLDRLFQSAIATEHTMGLNNNRNFRHFRNNQADDDAAALNAFGDGQSLIGLEERFEFTIMAGKKLLSYFDHLTSITPEGPHKSSFVEAGGIIKHRLEFLVDSLEFQLPRLKRAKAHTNLNRTGLESRTASTANTLSFQIAQESKADSTAMKAIAVLTMFFLPATFVAAFFAMPLFDWSAERGSEVVGGRFWVYWVVTVPGTVLVLGVWRAWWSWDDWKGKNEGERGWRGVRKWVGSWWKRGEVVEKRDAARVESAPGGKRDFRR